MRMSELTVQDFLELPAGSVVKLGDGTIIERTINPDIWTIVGHQHDPMDSRNQGMMFTPQIIGFQRIPPQLIHVPKGDT